MKLWWHIVIVSALSCSSGPKRETPPAPVARTPVPEYECDQITARTSGNGLAVYSCEPRDPTFAEAREALFRKVFVGIKQTISPDLDLDVTCKTTTCRVVVRFHGSLDDETSGRVQTLPWGDRMSVTITFVDGKRVLVLYPVMTAAMASISAQEALMRKVGVLTAP